MMRRIAITGISGYIGAQLLDRLVGHPEVETVVGISTDKACKPVNVMGMTKAVQERIFIQGNMRCPGTRFVCVRYGNVLASRGSVIPLFHEQLRNGGPVTITTVEMTRFLLSLDDAVDTVFAALREAKPGEIYVPRAPSALITNVAKALIEGRDIKTEVDAMCGGPPAPPKFGEKIVAAIKWVDGTVIDCVRQIDA